MGGFEHGSRTGEPREAVRELAMRQPGPSVLSVYVRTDPRDPDNTAATPRWLVELRNALRELASDVEAHGAREQRLAVRELRERVDRDVPGLDPRERARGIAWFLTSDNTLDHRLTLQLPPRKTLVRWDDRPFVSPLVDVVDRGRAAGIVLVAAEAVRLLHWEAGRVEEPQQSVYELELGEWRDYDAYARAHPGRSATGMHVATLDQRVKEWRQRFLREAAAATGGQVSALGWDRVLLAGEARSLGTFLDSLAGEVRERVVATVDANLLWEESPAVGERLEEALEEAWRREAHALVEQAIRAAHQGGAGALGWAEVLDTLVQHRVDHLVFAADATPDPGLLAPQTAAALGSPPAALLVERAVEHAIVSGAAVTAVPQQDAGPLAPVGGVVATLRY